MSKPEHIAAAAARTEQIENMRLALSRAEAAAAGTESARLSAESSYATLVADALASGGKLPPKPTDLSSAQAADDVADSALDILRRRLDVLKADHASRVQGEILEEATEWYAERKQRAAQAIGSLRASLNELATLSTQDQVDLILSRIVPKVHYDNRAPGEHLKRRSEWSTRLTRVGSEGMYALGDLETTHPITAE